ncbi:hypothetical protein ERJ75_000505000 [Trypanosoma vivax]|nr:hypothetical protein ERJ75_000505000 [Trypanosoma vivax]
MHVYLWDTRDGCHTLGRVANEAINSTSDLSHTFLFQLLLLILKQPFSDFLDVKVSTHANGTVETFLLVARSMAYIEIPLLQPTPRMVRCWGCIFPSIPVPECGTRDVGFVVFAKVVRRLLEKHIESAFGYFLGRIDEFDEEQRQNSWRNLVVYLLRSEQVLWRLCEIPALKSHLLGSERGASSNNNMFCFYIYVREALLSHRQRQEDVDTLVNILLDSAHTYLLQADIPPETLPQSAGSVPDTEESSTKVVQLLSNEGDLDSALRLAQNLVSRGRFLSLYKARLAHRLLHMITTARLQILVLTLLLASSGVKKLGLEKALCVRLLSGPSDEQGAIQHMIRMCCDVEAMFDGQVLLHKNECTNERVKLNVEMISPFVWPPFRFLK